MLTKQLKVLKSVKRCTGTSVLDANFQLYTMFFYKVKIFSLTGRTSEAKKFKAFFGSTITQQGIFKSCRNISLNIVEEIQTSASWLMPPEQRYFDLNIATTGEFCFFNRIYITWKHRWTTYNGGLNANRQRPLFTRYNCWRKRCTCRLGQLSN